jgi:hypothetical protein
VPTPLLPSIAQALGLNAIAGVGSSITDPVLRGVAQWGNAQTLTAIPDVGTLFALAGQSLISREQLDRALRWHGAALPGAAGLNSFQGGLWEQVLEAHASMPSIDAVMSAWAHGLLSDAQWRRGIERAGGYPDTWQRFLPAYYAVPSVGDLVVARNRGLLTPQQFEQQLRRHGFVLPSDGALIDALREQIPPISDLLRFSHKEAMQPELANELGFYNEYPYNLEPWLAAQGMFGGPGFTVRRDGREVQATWLDLYNAAEWQPISPGQAYTMLHRIRPDNVEKFRRVGLDVQPFTTADVEKWLRIGDYPQPIRPYLIATAYATNRLVDIRNALMLGVRDAEWARGQFLDRGLHPDDAQFAVDLAVRQNEEKRAGSGARGREGGLGSGHRRHPRGLRVGHARPRGGRQPADRGGDEPRGGRHGGKRRGREGVHEAGTVRRACRPARLPRRGADGAGSRRGAPGRRDAAGPAAAHAERLVRGAWARAAGRQHAAGPRLVPGGAHHPGGGSAPPAEPGLGRAGRAVAPQQLRPEGGSGPGQAGRRGAAVAAAQAAQLEKLQKQLLAEREKVQATLRRLSPTSKLQAWYVKGIISEDFFRRRMLSMGYDEGSTNQHFEEARKKKEESDAKARKTGRPRKRLPRAPEIADCGRTERASWPGRRGTSASGSWPAWRASAWRY